MLESEAAVHRTELELPETAAPTQQCGLLIFQPMVHAPVVTGSPIPLEDDFLTSTSCRGGRDYSEHVHWDTLAYSSLHSHLRSYYPRLQALAGTFSSPSKSVALVLRAQHEPPPQTPRVQEDVGAVVDYQRRGATRTRSASDTCLGAVSFLSLIQSQRAAPVGCNAQRNNPSIWGVYSRGGDSSISCSC